MADNAGTVQRGDPDTWGYWLYWKDGKIDIDVSLIGLPADDNAFALLLFGGNPGHMHNVPGRSGGWYLWDGKCHHPDDSDAAGKVVVSASLRLSQALDNLRKAITRDVNNTPDNRRKDRETALEDLMKPAIRYVAGLVKNAGKTAALGYAATKCGTSRTELDEALPNWLNCDDGTWNLRTMRCEPHDPADMITYVLPYAPDWSEKCPMFLDAVHRLAGRDDDVAKYILRVLGYTLIGDNPERSIFFWVGPTGSGKTVVLDVVRRILGDLASPDMGNDLICVTRHGRNARTEFSIMGKRLVVVAESSEHRKIEEAQVKRLTGESVVAIDQHYAVRKTEARRTWTIIMPSNEMPSTGKVDSAIRDRFVIIPTGATVPAEERVKDLASKIVKNEGPAVLGLLMHYAWRYYREGLPAPLAVAAKSDAYFGSQDQVAAFLADTALMGPGRHVDRPDAYKRYKDWAGDDRSLSRNAFYEELGKQPGITVNEGSRRFEGLCWREFENVPYMS